MLAPNLIKEAVVLRAQIEKGVIVIPAITSFLSKLEIKETVATKRKSKNDLLADELALMDKRKKPVKR